jgi:hypothetical protein
VKSINDSVKLHTHVHHQQNQENQNKKKKESVSVTARKGARQKDGCKKSEEKGNKIFGQKRKHDEESDESSSGSNDGYNVVLYKDDTNYNMERLDEYQEDDFVVLDDDEASVESEEQDEEEMDEEVVGVPDSMVVTGTRHRRAPVKYTPIESPIDNYDDEDNSDDDGDFDGDIESINTETYESDHDDYQSVDPEEEDDEADEEEEEDDVEDIIADEDDDDDESEDNGMHGGRVEQSGVVARGNVHSDSSYEPTNSDTDEDSYGDDSDNVKKKVCRGKSKKQSKQLRGQLTIPHSLQFAAYNELRYPLKMKNEPINIRVMAEDDSNSRMQDAAEGKEEESAEAKEEELDNESDDSCEEDNSNRQI